MESKIHTFRNVTYYFYGNGVAVHILCFFVECVLHYDVKRLVHLRRCVARVSHT